MSDLNQNGNASRTMATQFSCDVFCLNPKIGGSSERRHYGRRATGGAHETEIFVIKKRSRMPLRSFYVRLARGHRLPCCTGFSLADQGSHSDPRGDFAPYRALFSVSCAHPFLDSLPRMDPTSPQAVTNIVNTKTVAGFQSPEHLAILENGDDSPERPKLSCA
jgi:hypothetical protein